MEESNHEVRSPGRTVTETNGAHPEPLERNGTTLNGLADGPSSEQPGGHQSLFWSGPVTGQEELNWFLPPVPDREGRDAQLEQMLDRFGGMLDQQPKRAWLLKWNYRTRAAASGAELSDVEREARVELARRREQGERDVVRLDAKIAALREHREQIEAELFEARKDFAECAARAGLTCVPPETASTAGRRKHPPVSEARVEFQAATISPQRVEEALEDTRPTLLEMAGEHGVGPIGRSDFLSTLLQFFMQFLAPLVAGLMLALSLGTLIGLLDIDTLLRADGGPQLALCAALGFVIVYLMGEVYHAAVAMLARSLEARTEWERGGALPVPRLKAALTISVTIACVAALLGLAEITAEGLGIRQLHNQEIARQRRFRTTSVAGQSPDDVPFFVYMLIGTLISGPYLVYKSARGWSENEGHLREAWLTHRQRVWMEERRAEPDVQQTFHRAYTVEHLENSLGEVKEQIHEAEAEREIALQAELHPQIQARRRSARAAAVGEAARLQQMLEEIVDRTEPMPQRASDRNVVTPAGGGPRSREGRV